jgi:hypothetical protein
MPKVKISIQEAQEAMNLYYKLTGEKITTPEKLKHVHKVISEFLETKRPKVYF